MMYVNLYFEIDYSLLEWVAAPIDESWGMTYVMVQLSKKIAIWAKFKLRKL